MSHLGENLARLLAANGQTVDGLAEAAGVDRRTIAGALRGQRPHARTLARLAEGLGVATDELFVDPARLIYRRFDRQTNPAVEEALLQRPEIFGDWTEADFDELHSHVGAGGPLTVEGALVVAERINRKRDLIAKLALLLETSQAEVVARLIDVLYEEATARRPSSPG